MTILDVYAIEKRLRPTNYMVGLCNVDEIILQWPLISKELEKVRHVWEADWTIDELYNRALEQTIQVWTVGPREALHMFVFSYTYRTPVFHILRCFLAFGNHLDDGLQILAATLHRFCLMRGCDQIEVVGREGWKAKLEPIGFRVHSMVLRAKVQQERVH